MASNSAPLDVPSHPTRQPTRQTRTNPTRLSKTVGRSLVVGQSSNHSLIGSALTGNHLSSVPNGMYPGVTHFSDAIDALPREFRRHNSLLNEVDGKSWALEEQLPQLLNVASNLISVDYSNAATPPTPTNTIARQKVFHNIRNTLSDLLGIIDEKNHVARNANASLKRDVGRLDAVYPYVQREISDEARLGSLTHWAYINKSNAKPSGNTANERPRRDNAGGNGQRIKEADLDIETKKEATSRRQRRNQADLEGDESRFPTARRNKPGPKSRATEAQPVDQNVASGPTTLAPSAGGTKRRKVENSGTSIAMERSASTTTNRGGSKDSAASETVKRRTRAPNASTTSRKRTNTIISNMGSSSLASTTAIPATNALATPANSPLLNPSARSQVSKPQQPSSALAGANRQRPSSSASNRNANSSMFSGPGSHPLRPSNSPANAEKEPLETRPQSVKGLASPKIEPASARANDINETTRPSSTLSSETRNAGLQYEFNDTTQSANTNHQNTGSKRNFADLPELTTTLTGKPGRSSKSATPVVSTFAESQRSKPTRTGDGPTKRSHKKSSSISTPRQRVLTTVGESGNGSPGMDDEDDTEPRYCYCNEVSFGEMVACDNPNCPREWFHLSCVGLTKPPAKTGMSFMSFYSPSFGMESMTKANVFLLHGVVVVWYCNECKDISRKGRPGNGK
ncbi:hypothetical protein FQN57_003162 [Myotisia sp. PD_48]|nr:hypothetical protein FQN57_003162 [Myotisia sp. PD_48]